MGASIFLFCLATVFIVITSVYVHAKKYGMAVGFAFLSLIDIIFSAVKYIEVILKTYLGG